MCTMHFAPDLFLVTEVAGGGVDAAREQRRLEAEPADHLDDVPGTSRTDGYTHSDVLYVTL